MSPTETDHICLKKLCFRVVRRHFDSANIRSVLDLPAPLIQDLLPHLTVCQLDELQPALNGRGISTLPGWVAVFSDMRGHKHAVASSTEAEAKHKVMKTLFPSVFYGFTDAFIRRNISNLRSPSFLKAAAKCVRKFTIMKVLEPLRALTAEQRPLLKVLEETIHSVAVSNCIRLSREESQIPRYVLHRLLDHGVAEALSVHGTCAFTLAWLLYGRGSEPSHAELRNLKERRGCSGEDEVPRKRFKSADVSSSSSTEEQQQQRGESDFTVHPQTLCQMFSPGDGASSSACLRGRLDRLEVTDCGVNCLGVVCVFLPTFFSLRSLTLSTSAPLTGLDVSILARALRRLCSHSSASLAHFNLCLLPNAELIETLLAAAPRVTDVQVEVLATARGQGSLAPPRVAESDPAEWRLEKLTIKLVGANSDLDMFKSMLRRSPHLTSFSVTGLRLSGFSSVGELLTTLAESNPLLVHLSLEDTNLSDCVPQILHLLRSCRLKELQLKDCRLLEKWSNKEESFQQLVAAVRAATSLHTLGLAHNRLAKNVCVLVELFSEGSPTSLRRLDLSSNFIQPADLLDFAKGLQKGGLSQQLTLDLSRNPWDRDPDTWSAALEQLSTVCHVQVEGWASTNTMADYISNM